MNKPNNQRIPITQEIKNKLNRISVESICWKNVDWVRSFCENVAKQEDMSIKQWLAYKRMSGKLDNQYKSSRYDDQYSGWGDAWDVADSGSGYYDV